MDRIDADGIEKFFFYAMKMFFVRYAEGSYFDASVWGRRMAETYCYGMLHFFNVKLDDGFHGLYDLTWMLPDWVWKYGAYAHVLAYGQSTYLDDIALGFGMPLSSWSIYYDLEMLRLYGNRGAHASRYLRGERMKADSRVVPSVLRVAMSFSAWYLRCQNGSTLSCTIPRVSKLQLQSILCKASYGNVRFHYLLSMALGQARTVLSALSVAEKRAQYKSACF